MEQMELKSDPSPVEWKPAKPVFPAELAGDETGIVVNAKWFLRDLRWCALAASDDEWREDIAVVRFELEQQLPGYSPALLTLTATDGPRLHRQRIQVRADGTDETFYLEAVRVKKELFPFFRGIKKNDRVIFIVGESEAEFRIGDRKLELPLADVEFPDVEERVYGRLNGNLKGMFPLETPVVPDYLKDQLKEHKNWSRCPCTVFFSENGGNVRVKTGGSTVVHYERFEGLPDMRVGLNARYLSQALQGSKDGLVPLEFRGEHEPVFLPNHKLKRDAVIMPMTI